MKNKKLFAILTLVCFMFTLMPVAAFAAAPVVPEVGAYVVKSGTDKDSVSVDANTALTVAVTGSTLNYYFWAEDADENVVYETENYSYSGKAPNLIDLIEDYLDMEHETVADYDEYGTLSAIGSVEAGEVTSHDDNTNEDVTLYTAFWWYRVNGKDGTDMMEEYAVKDGDVIEYYLSKKK